MEPTTKTPAAKAISAILVVVVILVLGYIFTRKPVAVAPIDETPDVATPAPRAISGNTADLVSVSLAAEEHVAGTLTVTGSLKGTYFFEATAQGKVLDANKNEIKAFMLTATTDWMTAEPVAFKGTVDLAGIPAGQGFIRLQNDNPSGDPVNDKFIDIPVVIN